MPTFNHKSGKSIMSVELYKEVRKVIDFRSRVILSTAVGGNSCITQIRYINDGFDLYFYISGKTKTAAQLKQNPNVELLFTGNPRANTGEFVYEGLAERVKNEEKAAWARRNFLRRFSDAKRFLGYSQTELYKISPLTISGTRRRKNEEDRLTFKENKRSDVKLIGVSFLRWIRLWLQAMRAPFFTASIAPVIVGTAVAYFRQAAMDWRLLLIALTGAVSAHAGMNILNDYYDHRTGVDDLNTSHNAFSGGSRMIQNGLLSPQKTLVAATFFSVIAIGLGLYLNHLLPGNTLLWIGLAGFVLGISYSATPFSLAHRGVGEIAVALGFGVVIVLGSYFVQTGSLDWLPVLASVPTSILVGLILYINEFPDAKSDAAGGKKTMVVRLKDKKRAIRVYQIMLVLALLWIVGFVIAGLFPIWTLAALLPIPLVIIALRISATQYKKIYDLLPVNALTIAIHLGVSLLLSVGFIIGILF